jgi:hypothetical protein
MIEQTQPIYHSDELLDPQIVYSYAYSFADEFINLSIIVYYL